MAPMAVATYSTLPTVEEAPAASGDARAPMARVAAVKTLALGAVLLLSALAARTTVQAGREREAQRVSDLADSAGKPGTPEFYQPSIMPFPTYSPTHMTALPTSPFPTISAHPTSPFPTVMPTYAPSAKPTIAPTPKPSSTFAPTVAPTATPTKGSVPPTIAVTLGEPRPTQG